MDSKPTEQEAESNVIFVSNVWIKPGGEEPTPWEAADHVPGDLRIRFDDVQGLDTRVLKPKLTRRQLAEVSAYRFWLPFGSDVEALSRAPRKLSPPANANPIGK